MTASDHLAPQALASLELFQDLPSAALDDVLTSARVWRLPRETRIFNQGDAGRAHALLEASWSEAELFVLMGRHPQIAINVIRVIGKRLQEVQDRLRGVPPNGSN